MSIYRAKGSKIWTMDFHFEGQRIRESTKTRSKIRAGRIERKRRTALEDGREGWSKKKKKHHALLFTVAAEKFLEKKNQIGSEGAWAPKTRSIAENAYRHLLPSFAGRLLLDIEPDDVRRYQKKRTAEGAAPRTINIEVGFLRSVMGSTWALLQADKDDKVSFLKEPKSIGRKLSPDEEARLLHACSNSRSRVLYPFVVLAIETGARKNVIRTLLWKQIDFANKSIQFGHDKTEAGSGRIIPLNQRALEVLKMWAVQFPNREGEHFVFPAERYGAAGDEFATVAYATDPGRPVGSIKEAWEAAQKRAGVKCRFHDLRHTSVSRMLDAHTPMDKVAEIVGWSDSTAVAMSLRYGHNTVDDLRSAVETMTAKANIPAEQGYPLKSPLSDTKTGGKLPN